MVVPKVSSCEPVFIHCKISTETKVSNIEVGEIHTKNCTPTMVSKGLRLDLGTKVYRTVHFVHTGYAFDSTQSIHKFSISSYKKQNKKMYYCSAS